MKLPKSKVGKTLAGVYILFALFFIVILFRIGGFSQIGLAILPISLPALPWFYFGWFLIDKVPHEILDMILFSIYIISLLLNAIIVYLIGFAIEKLYRKITHHS